MRTRLARAALLMAWLTIPLLSGCWPCKDQDCSDCPKEPTEVGLTIALVENCKADPATPHLSRSPDKTNHVRWYNKTDVQQTISINAAYWPFMEAHEDIVIDGGKYSAWYTVSESGGESGIPFNYHVLPLIPPGCGPGEPSITVDP